MVERPLTDTELSRLAIFPLPSAVLFPSATLPLHVFEPRYRKLVADCLARDLPLAIWQIDPRGAQTEWGPALHRVATAGRIGTHVKLPDGRLDIIVVGVDRVRFIGEDESGEPYRVVRAERHPLVAVEPASVAGRVETLRGLAGMLAKQHPRAARLLTITLNRCSDPAELSDVLCTITHDDGQLRQDLLETSNIPERLEKVIGTLSGLVLETGIGESLPERM